MGQILTMYKNAHFLLHKALHSASQIECRKQSSILLVSYVQCCQRGCKGNTNGTITLRSIEMRQQVHLEVVTVYGLFQKQTLYIQA